MAAERIIRTVDDLKTTERVAITHTEAATLLGVDPRTVAASIESGELQAVRLGRKLLIPKQAFMTMFGISAGAA